MNTGKQQKPVLTGQRFKTRKRGESLFISIFHILPLRSLFKNSRSNTCGMMLITTENHYNFYNNKDKHVDSYALTMKVCGASVQ